MQQGSVAGIDLNLRSTINVTGVKAYLPYFRKMLTQEIFMTLVTSAEIILSHSGAIKWVC